MLLECRLEMSEGELRRLPGRDLRRPAQCTQGRADRGLGLLKTLPDAVCCGIAESALEALESLAFIAGEDGLPEKLPQAVGGQKESFDFVSGPNAEGTSAAAGTIPIVAEDAPSADRFLAQLLLGIASQKPVSDQASDLFAMRTSRRFQLGEHRFDILLGTTNPAAHDIPQARRKGNIIRGQQAGRYSQTVTRNERRGMMSMTRAADCKVRAAGGVLELPN